MQRVKSPYRVVAFRSSAPYGNAAVSDIHGLQRDFQFVTVWTVGQHFDSGARSPPRPPAAAHGEHGEDPALAGQAACGNALLFRFSEFCFAAWKVGRAMRRGPNERRYLVV